MDFCSLLRSSSLKFNSIVCLGLDPVLDTIPIEKGSPGERIRSFYETMLNTMARRNIMPAAVKPNYAFYAQYGLDGIGSLAAIIDACRGLGLPVILDVKRGDIGATAEAYAREAYDFFNADAVTLSPYLGFDSIEPFFSRYPDKGAYILNKTSNKSSGELQDVLVDGEPLYLRVSRKIVEWHRPGMGGGGSHLSGGTGEHRRHFHPVRPRHSPAHTGGRISGRQRRGGLLRARSVS